MTRTIDKEKENVKCGHKVVLSMPVIPLPPFMGIYFKLTFCNPVLPNLAE